MKRKKYLYITIIILIMVLIGGIYLGRNIQKDEIQTDKPISEIDISSLDCDELKDLYDLEDTKFDYTCNIDSDCIQRAHPFGCTECTSRNISNDDVDLALREILDVRIEKGCIPRQPDVLCAEIDCSCIEGICTSVD